MSRSLPRFAVFASLSIALAIPEAALAQTDLVGIPVAPAHKGSETQPRIISDHAGGAFVGFAGADTFFVARLHSDGTPEPSWKALRVPNLHLEPLSGSRFAWLRPNTIMAMSDFFDNGIGLQAPPFWYRQSTDTGIVSPEDSITTLIRYVRPELVEQPNGTVLIVNLGNNSASGFAEFRNAYVESNGDLVEGFTTPLTGTASNNLVTLYCRAIPADGGGAWAVGEVFDGTYVYTDIVAARIQMNGTSALTPGHRVITAATRNQRQPALASDGAGGVFVAWTDGRTLATGDDIYAIHLTATGSLVSGWTTGGKVISNATGTQVQPAIVSDGAGGAWIAWVDARNGENDIYFTHVLGNGTLAPGFPAGGASLCGAVGGQVDVQLAADGAGGFFALWLDQRDGETDVYGHHVAANGSAISGWSPGGLPVSTHPVLQRTPRLLVMTPQRALAVWGDSRSGTEKIYVATMNDQTLSVPALSSAALSLHAVRAPFHGDVELVLAAADGDPVDIALLDIAGRVVARQRVEAGGSAVPVRFAGPLAPGLYFARANQAGHAADCRAVVIR